MERKEKIFCFRNNKKNSAKGQTMIEFTFCMIVTMLMLYSTIMIFRWAGLDIVNRRKAHEALLNTGVAETYPTVGDGPQKQISRYFYRPMPMKAVWNGN